ncbi:MAG: DUF1622 domain-containing protein [Clostridiales bacterium]|nr:DUF1622 domain-containing protein [Clostridiales bacterium]MDO4351255.1 DUF1622 domain-containing protein [Eubacteriales bacterium]MDY4009470.1 DUF1622 domain-containing protein [Candidatus Limiplasma sp.]
MLAIEHGFETIVRFCILLIELAGIAVIVISMVQGFIGYIRKQEQTRIQLAQGIMLGLEFKIGSEVLRSVIISGWTELGTLAAIILLRSLLTLLLHWEIDVEEKRQRERAGLLSAEKAANSQA